MEHVYASMDIGSDTIKIVVCELYNSRLNLLAATSTESKGIKKDLIYKPDQAIISIKNALRDVESMLGVTINKVIATVPSYQIEYKVIKGQINVTGNLIESDDIKAIYREGIKRNLPFDKEFVNIVPIDFVVNDKVAYKNPIGFPGSKLLARAMMIISPKKNVYSVASILESIGIQLADISVSSIGDIFAFKSKLTDSNVGVVVNIGSEITTVSLYNKSIPVNTRIINMAGKDIDGDIAFMYKLDLAEAKKIKEIFAVANKLVADTKDVYETSDLSGLKIKINQKEVSEIVMARLEEIFTLVKKEINLLTKRKIQYIIITGGVSNSVNIESIAQKILGSKVSVGKIKMLGVRNNKYSVALGNLIYFINNMELKGNEETMLSGDDMDILSSPNKNFINASSDTMLGKVFGYFFGE